MTLVRRYFYCPWPSVFFSPLSVGICLILVGWKLSHPFPSIFQPALVRRMCFRCPSGKHCPILFFVGRCYYYPCPSKCPSVRRSLPFLRRRASVRVQDLHGFLQTLFAPWGFGKEYHATDRELRAQIRRLKLRIFSNNQVHFKARCACLLLFFSCLLRAVGEGGARGGGGGRNNALF